MLEVIALSPPCFPNQIVAQAAHRAGYSGGVALEYITPEQAKSVLYQSSLPLVSLALARQQPLAQQILGTL